MLAAPRTLAEDFLSHKQVKLYLTSLLLNVDEENSDSYMVLAKSIPLYICETMPLL